MCEETDPGIASGCRHRASTNLVKFDKNQLLLLLRATWRLMSGWAKASKLRKKSVMVTPALYPDCIVSKLWLRKHLGRKQRHRLG